MATYGKISEFDLDSDDWQQYMERMEFYFVANKITDEDQQKAIFLSACGGKVYSVLRDLCLPGKPGDYTLTEIWRTLSNHFTPKPNAIVERFKFNSKVRQAGQTIASFVAELRRMTEHCGYGATLDDMIRDRLVCGVNDDHIQKRLLSEPDGNLTLRRAVQLATAMETAVKDVAMLQRSGVEEPVHKVQPVGEDRRTPPPGGCFRCGANHVPAECRFMDAICHNCHKRGHIARKCRSARQPRQNRGNTRGQTHKLEQDEEEEETTHMLYNLDDEERVEPYRETMSVNGQDIEFEIDTGAGMTILN